MATFKQWRVRSEARRITWLCGTELVLVEEVIDTIRKAVGANVLDSISMTLPDDKERDVWAAINTYPSSDAAPRLVVVRSAQRIKRWESLQRWMDDSKLMPTVRLVFVTNEEDLRQEAPLTFMKGSTKVSLVRCGKLQPEDAVDWCLTRSNSLLSRTTAAHLIERVGGDLGRAKSVCDKVKLIGGADNQAVDLLASAVDDDFVDALCAMDKSAAVQAARAVPQSDIARIIGSLDYRLNLLGELHGAVRKGRTLTELAQAGELKEKELPLVVYKRLFPVAKHYSAERVASCRQALAFADAAARNPGALEALVVLW